MQTLKYLLTDLVRKRYSGSPECKLALMEKPLGYEKLSFLFVMLIFGFIMSIVVVSLEYITQSKENKQDVTYKDKEISLVAKMGEYLEGLSEQETENILDRLNKKHVRKNK